MQLNPGVSQAFAGMTTTDADKLAYCSCMEQIKRRLGIINSLTSRRVTTGDEGADGEFCCLQIRKVLEQLAFASLAASRARYAEVHKKFDREWRAKQILERLRDLHPDFYPVALFPSPNGPGRWHFDRLSEGYLTESDFVFLYDKCSSAIHDWNPFTSDERVIQLERPISEWAERVEKLLLYHSVRLIDQSDVLVVQLYDEAGKAHVFTATPQAG